MPHKDFNKSHTAFQAVPGNIGLTRSKQLWHKSWEIYHSPVYRASGPLLTRRRLATRRFRGCQGKFNQNTEVNNFKSNQVIIICRHRNCWAFQRICQNIPSLQNIPIYVQDIKYSSPMVRDVYNTITSIGANAFFIVNSVCPVVDRHVHRQTSDGSATGQ